MNENGLGNGKENVRRIRDGMHTDRARTGTLSPSSNPEGDRRVSLN